MSKNRANLLEIYETAALLDIREREIRLGSHEAIGNQTEQFQKMFNLLAGYGLELFISGSLTAEVFVVRVVRADKVLGLYLSPDVNITLPSKEMTALGYVSKLILQTAEKYLIAGTISAGDAPTLFEFIAGLISQGGDRCAWMEQVEGTKRLYRLSKLVNSGYLPSALVANQAANGLIRLSPRMDHQGSAHLLAKFPLVNEELAIKVLGSLTVLKANRTEKELVHQAAQDCVVQLEAILLTHKGLEHVNSTSLAVINALIVAFAAYI